MKNLIAIPRRLNNFLKSYWLAEPAMGIRRIIIIYLTLFSILAISVLFQDYLLITLAILASSGVGAYLWFKIKKYGFYYRTYSIDLLGNRVEIIKHSFFRKGKLRLKKVFDPLDYQKILKTRKDRKILFRYPSENDFQSYRNFINRIVRENVLIEVKKRYTLEKAQKQVSKKIEKIREKKGIEIFVFYRNRVIGEGLIVKGEGKQDHVGTMGYFVDRDFRREGIGEQLNCELIRLGKKALSLKLLIANVVISNPVIKIFRKYGFRSGGMVPRKFYHQGNYLKMTTLYLKL